MIEQPYIELQIAKYPHVFIAHFSPHFIIREYRLLLLWESDG